VAGKHWIYHEIGHKTVLVLVTLVKVQGCHHESAIVSKKSSQTNCANIRTVVPV